MTTRLKSMMDELDDARDKRTRSFQVAIMRIVSEVARPHRGSHALADAVESLGRVIADAKQWANVLGRRRLLLELEHRRQQYGMPVGAAFCLAYSNQAEQLAKVEFVEATKDILERSPEIRKGYRSVQKLYNEGHGFALAKSSQIAVTERVQSLVSNALKNGQPIPDFEGIMTSMTDWSRAYAETVFRTNLSSAYAAGRMQQAADPALDEFVPAIRRVATVDGDTRPNHMAAHGLVARKRDSIWLKLGVPAGYNCRCGLQLLDRIMIDRMNIDVPVKAEAPPGAYNDLGFENRQRFEVWGI